MKKPLTKTYVNKDRKYVGKLKDYRKKLYNQNRKASHQMLQILRKKRNLSK